MRSAFRAVCTSRQKISSIDFSSFTWEKKTFKLSSLILGKLRKVYGLILCFLSLVSICTRCGQTFSQSSFFPRPQTIKSPITMLRKTWKKVVDISIWKQVESVYGETWIRNSKKVRQLITYVLEEEQ